MKYARLILVVFLFIFSVQALAQDSGCLTFSKKYLIEHERNLRRNKSNLIFIDSTNLEKSLIANEEIRHLVKSTNDTSGSFIATLDFNLVNNQLIPRKSNYAVYDYYSPFVKYTKSVFIKFKFKEGKLSQKEHWITTEWMYYLEKKEIIVTVSEVGHELPIYKKSFPLSLWENQSELTLR